MKNYKSTDDRCAAPQGGHRYVFMTPMNPMGYCWVCEPSEYQKTTDDYYVAEKASKEAREAEVRRIVRDEMAAQHST